MDNIEQEFFEAFNYKPKIIYHIAHKRSGCWNKYMTTSAKEYVKLKFQNEKDLKIYKVEFIYPSITPEIVLELMKIIQSNFPKNAILEIRAGLDFTTQVLNSCIQFQPKIQDQIKGLFNGK